MSYKLEFSYNAENDLRDIAFYILAESKSLDIAVNFVETLRLSVNNLVLFPFSGNNPRNRLLINLGYKYIVKDDYLIFYSIDEKSKHIYIVAILNGRQNYVSILKKRL